MSLQLNRQMSGGLPSDYFDTVTVTVAPNNRVMVSKKPHKILHKYRDDFESTEDRDRKGGYLASLQNCNESQNQLKIDLPPIPKRKKFSRAARQTILAAAGALEKSGYAPGNFWFFTGTLPGTSSRACEGIARYSRYIVNRMKQALRRKGLDLTFNTWEWQKRDNVHGHLKLTPALHLHLVICCPSEVGYEWLEDFLREKWFDILDSVSCNKFGFNLYEKDSRLFGVNHSRKSPSVIKKCCRTIQCIKSPAAYLSKYVGKGSKDDSRYIRKYCEDNKLPLFYPSSWWSVSKHLKSLISQYTHSFSVRISPQDSRRIFDDISDFIKSIGIINLNEFNPEGFPEYSFRCSYIPSNMYEDTCNILESIFSEYHIQFAVVEKTALQKSVSFDDVLYEWIHLPRNEYFLQDFLFSLPAYYQMGGCKIDWFSGGIRGRLREYHQRELTEFWDDTYSGTLKGF